uniref:Uncharacterized protein n=1 Tax=Rhizophora mucronata TaxID=61149 RepID=A0A2P2NB89_RHIMU
MHNALHLFILVGDFN